MYANFIQDCLLNGGAVLDKISTFDIPETNVRNMLSQEAILNPIGSLDRIPPINQEILKNDPKLVIGVQTLKICKLILSKEEGDKLVSFVNDSIKARKTKLREDIENLKKKYDETCQKYRDSLVLGQAGKEMDMTTYFETIENKIKLAKGDMKKIDDEYKKTIKDIIDNYHQAKRGRHPPIADKSKTLGITSFWKKNKIGVDTEGVGTPSVGVITTGKILVGDELIACDIVAIHLSKGIISIVYGKAIGDAVKHTNMDVNFKDLCINPTQ